MIIKGGLTITPKDVIENGFIKIEKDEESRARFTRVCSMGEVGPESLRDDEGIVDAEGKIVAPAFIDLHIQGIGGRDVWEASHEAVNEMSKTMTQFGVGGFLATTHYDLDVIESLNASISTGTAGSQVLGLHLEGPFVNPVKKGAIPEGFCVPIFKDAPLPKTIGQLREMITSCGPHLKIMTLAPELDGADKLMEILRENGVVASAGHSDATYEEAMRGIEAGVSHSTHFMNAMRGFHHREPGLVGAVLTDERVTTEVIADGVHLHPAAIRLIARCKGPSKMAVVTDSIRSAAAPAHTTPFGEGGLKAEISNGGPRLADGTLAGSILTMDRAVKNMVELANAPLKDAVTMATLTPAEIIGAGATKGSIEPGKDADVAILDKELRVEMTLIDGEIRFRRQ